MCVCKYIRIYVLQKVREGGWMMQVIIGKNLSRLTLLTGSWNEEQSVHWNGPLVNLSIIASWCNKCRFVSDGSTSSWKDPLVLTFGLFHFGPSFFFFLPLCCYFNLDRKRTLRLLLLFSSSCRNYLTRVMWILFHSLEFILICQLYFQFRPLV